MFIRFRTIVYRQGFPACSEGISVLDSMIGISSREQELMKKGKGNVSRVRPLRQGFCEKKYPTSTPLCHKLQTQKRHGLLASRMSPIELPVSQRDDEQSHDYRTTTKGNPIQGRPKSPFPSLTLNTHPIVTGGSRRMARKARRE